MDIRFIARPADGRSGHDGLLDHARQRLRLRLRHRTERVAHVSVRLGDSGSLRGLRDTYCVMRVQLRDVPAATVVDIGADACHTIDRATDRVGQLVEALLSVADGRRPASAGSEAAA